MQTSKKLQYTYTVVYSNSQGEILSFILCISKIGRKLLISKMVIILLSAIRSI